MSEAIAGTDDEIGKCVIGMQFRFRLSGAAPFVRFGPFDYGEFDGNEVAGYLLGGAGEGDFGVLPEELGHSVVRAAYLEDACIEMHRLQLFEPFARIDRVERFCPFEDVRENIFYLQDSQVNGLL